MTVEPEEARAIAEAVQPAPTRPAADVSARNFDEPRRLSATDLARVSRQVEAVLPDVSDELQVTLRGQHKLTLASVSEANVKGMLDHPTAPFALLSFRRDGRQGWLVWDGSAAAAAAETILAGVADVTDAEAEVRRLSPSECRLMETLLTQVVRPVLAALGSDVQEPRFVQTREELSSTLDAAPDDDTQRLLLHLAFEGPGGPSDLRLYIPGVAPEHAPAQTPVSDLPTHLGPVSVELCAYLGSVDIRLGDLLELETGDVIPLGIKAGDPVQLYVDGRACATASWGRHRGNIAVQIDRLDVRPDEIDDPTT